MARTAKVAAMALLSLIIVAAFAAIMSSNVAQAQQCRWGRPIIIGYAHNYDVIYQPVCGPYGCINRAVQIPCQHPYWGCP